MWWMDPEAFIQCPSGHSWGRRDGGAGRPDGLPGGYFTARDAGRSGAAGISPAYLNLIEHDRRNLTDAVRARLAEALDTSEAELEAGREQALLAGLRIAAAGEGCMATIEMPKVHPLIAPLVYAVPVQLLAYHVACVKGTDVDQPRNLAKSVTVE